jgi:capsule polysaccharide export protein KpsE/RkpR
MLVCRGNKVTAIEAELRATEETLQTSNASFANTYSQVSTTMAAWEILRKELEQALKDGMESWSLPTRNTESQQATANNSFERLLQKHAELSQQVFH